MTAYQGTAGMNSSTAGNVTSEVCWFVGSSYGGTKDQTKRFLEQAIWDVGNPSDKQSAQVRSMKPGERIAIKATYVRKNDLPFDNRGHSVSTMRIKAVGTITANPQDGEHVEVDWQPVDGIREWYFFTYRATIWRVTPDDWLKQGLIDFAFDDKPQDIERFCNEPFWRERFGTLSPEQMRFQWTQFYEAVAEKLLEHANDRTGLVRGIQEIATRVSGLGYLQEDRFGDGSTGALQDICPFTVMGAFNRRVREDNRKTICTELAQLLDVDVRIPSSFEGIPLLNNQNSWFFRFAKDRGANDIDALWHVFVAAHRLATEDQSDAHQNFVEAYDEALKVGGVKWNLSTGLYWSHPWDFLTLDGQSRNYIDKHLGINTPTGGQPPPLIGKQYVKLMDDLSARFGDESYPVHSFPELSLKAYEDPVEEPAEPSPPDEDATVTDDEADSDGDDTVQPLPPVEPYTLHDITKDGCFFEPDEIKAFVGRLRTRKNLILQGPPGTGKTWLAKRLAYALMGEKATRRLRSVQFHPNLSYEDFVRGWRPTGDGKLSLADGVFMEAIKAAANDPSSQYVVVIEEINRGNPAQIFGELLTLLEDSKRTPDEGVELSYPDADGIRRPVHIPPNLYVIGTMNLADRSLALVDMALRRRFAFADLEPRLGPRWREWVVKELGVDADLAGEIEQRINALNKQITNDRRLGKQFCVGHSYVTPASRLEAGQTRQWFEQVIQTELGPLLDEYWFDAPDETQKAVEQLRQGWR